jgi:hypothetical protein
VAANSRHRTRKGNKYSLCRFPDDEFARPRNKKETVVFAHRQLDIACRRSMGFSEQFQTAFKPTLNSFDGSQIIVKEDNQS